MTFVIITAGIDLSVGSVLVFSGVVSAKAMNGMDGDGWDVILVGVVVARWPAASAGASSTALLITKARVPPLIVTLGTLGMALGLALIITGGVDVREVPPKLVTSIGVGRLFDQIPWLVVIAAAVAVDLRRGAARRRASAATPTRSAPTTRRRGAPASTSTAT